MCQNGECMSKKRGYPWKEKVFESNERQISEQADSRPLKIREANGMTQFTDYTRSEIDARRQALAAESARLKK